MNQAPSPRQALLGLTLFSVTLFPLASGGHFRWGWSILVFLSSLLLLLFLWSYRKQDWKLPPLSAFFIGLISLHLIQLMPLPSVLFEYLAPVKSRFMHTLYPEGNWHSLSANVEATRDNLLLSCAAFSAFIIGWFLFHRRSRLAFLGITFIAIGSALSAYGCWVIIEKPPIKIFGVPNYGLDRLTATYTNANRFAGLLELILGPGLIGLIIYSTLNQEKSRRLISRIRSSMSKRMIIYFGVLSILWILSFIALLLTQSRMGIAAFFLSGSIASLMVYRKKLNAKVGLVLGCGLAVALLSGLSLALDSALDRFATLADVDTNPLTRPIIWKNCWPLIQDHWLLGGGSGSFRSLYQHYQPEVITGHARFAHNDYLNAATDLGVVGILLFISGMATWLFQLSKPLRTLPMGTRRLGLLGILWGIIAILIHSLTDSNLQEPANAWIFCLLLGAGLGMANQSKDHKNHHDSKNSPSKNSHSSNKSLRLAILSKAMVIFLIIIMALGGGAVFYAEAILPSSDLHLLRGHARTKFDESLHVCDSALNADAFWAQGRLLKTRMLNDHAASVTDPKQQDHYYQLAEIEANRTLQLSPMNVGAWYQKARSALMRNNDLKKARTCLQTALFASPYHPDLALAFAKISLLAWQNEGRPGNRVPTAILDALAPALKNRPHTLLETLAVLNSATDWEKRWEKIVPVKPTTYHAYTRWLLSNGYKSEAKEIIAQGLSLLKDSKTNMSSRIKARMSQIELEFSILFWALGEKKIGLKRMLLTFKKHSLLAKEKHGQLLLSLLHRHHLRDNGETLGEAIVSQYPKEAWAHDVQGMIARKNNKNEKAIQAFRHSLKIKNTAITHHHLAHALARSGRMDSALIEANQASQLDPGNGLYKLDQAYWLFRKSHFKRALDLLEAAEDLDPKLFDRCRDLRDKILRILKSKKQLK